MFSKFLTQFRQKHNLTQRQISKLLNMEQSQYNLYELGKKNPQDLKFINTFLKSFNDILTEEEKGFLNNQIEEYKYINSQSLTMFLRYFRKKYGFTQKQVADSMNIALNNYCSYESDKRKYYTYLRFIDRFIDIYKDILTEEELLMLKNIIEKINQNNKNLNYECVKIVKDVRLRNKITLRKMGDTLKLSRTYINDAEHGKLNFSNQNLLKFYTSYYYLLTEEEHKKLYEYLLKVFPSDLNLFNSNQENVEKVNMKTIN